MLGERVLELPGLGEGDGDAGRAGQARAGAARGRLRRHRAGHVFGEGLEAEGERGARVPIPGHHARVRRHDGVPQRDRGAEVLAKRVGVLGVHPKAQVHEPHRRATRRPPTIGGGDAKPLEAQERRAVRPARATA